MTTEARPAEKSGERYARPWVILSFQAGMLLVLLGATWLFSLVHDVSWIVRRAPPPRLPPTAATAGTPRVAVA